MRPERLLRRLSACALLAAAVRARCDVAELVQLEHGYFGHTGVEALSVGGDTVQMAGWQSAARRAWRDAEGCLARGGRYWALGQRPLENLTEGGEEEVKLFEDPDWPQTVPLQALLCNIGVCAPAACTATALRRLLPALFASAMCNGENVALSTLRRGASVFGYDRAMRIFLHRGYDLGWIGRGRVEQTLQELVAWKHFALDAAILGQPGCGTTSLAARLAEHPDIELLTDEREAPWHQDGGFFRRTRHPLNLPTPEEVRQFNSWTDGRGSGRLRAVKFPGYLDNPRTVVRLSGIPRLKGVIIVDDPVQQLERHFLKNAYLCRERNASLPMPALSQCVLDGRCGELCMPSIGLDAAVSDGEYFLLPQRWELADAIARAVEYFGAERLFLTHLDLLRDSPALLFGHLAEFLGVPPFATEQSYRVFNRRFSVPHRTGELRVLAMTARNGRVSELRMRSHLYALRSLFHHYAAERAELQSLFRQLSPGREPSWLVRPFFEQPLAV